MIVRSVLLILVLVLSGCQGIVDSNKLAIFEPNTSESVDYSDDHDLWKIIAENQAINVDENPRIQSHVDWISERPDYLAIVESDYYPFSYSHGTATGIWQFIPSTGRMYGLDEDWWHEDRRDVLASTKAAVQYLKDLNQMFDGDWLLSIAAYNAGPGRVQRAIDNNIKQGKKIDYWSLDLPKETEKYVPKLLAVAKVLKDPDRFNQKLTMIENKPYLEPVKLQSQFDLALIAQWTNLSIDEIYSFNPGLKRWATPETLPYTILLPVDVVDDFIETLSNQKNRPKVSWTRYKVKEGDSLSVIAQNFNTTINQIQSVNDIKGNLIRASSYLIVPLAREKEGYYSLSETQREKSRLNATKNSEKLIYKVVSGDSLWKISNDFSVTINELVRWNKIAPKAPLQIGKELVILIDDKEKTELAKITNTGIDINRKIVYTVKSGDNLSLIAQRYKVKVSQIRDWNDLNEKDILQPGDKLTITINVVNSNLS